MIHGSFSIPLAAALTFFSLGAVPSIAQDTAPLPISASPSEAFVPEYDVQATSRVLEKTVTQLEPFTYAVELTWEGAQQWFSLESPEVEWPEGIRQLEASQKSGSSVGETGPVGTKSFLYKLEAQNAGEARFPTIRVQLLAPGAKYPIAVEAPGTTLTVLERQQAPLEKFSAFFSAYRYVVVGVGALIVVAVFLLLRKNRKDARPGAPEPDPWAEVEEFLKKAESLRGAGRDREYYETLEKGVKEGRALAASIHNPADPDKIEGLPQTAAEDLQSLLSECSERKYRPDRPRPEEMDRSLRQARTVVKSLKELHQKRGS